MTHTTASASRSRRSPRQPGRAATHSTRSQASVRLDASERRLLLSLTALPTASGCEDAVQRALDLWVDALGHGAKIRRDDVGNSLIWVRGKAGAAAAAPPRLLITAHLDHPAFVVTRAINARELEFEFRGGVHDPYFDRAAIEIFPRDATTGSSRAAAPVTARIVALDAAAQPFKIVRARLDDRVFDARRIAAGSIGRWRLPKAEIAGGLLRTHACDDLAAVAIAMITFGRLIRAGHATGVGLLLTVAEEVGFLGAIRAARSGIVPSGATLLCLENSRSFPHDSPIGAGAILRVGDRLSVFTPQVTNALTQIYQRHAATHPGFKWQRKLMPGGACEATAFASLGHASTCLCLPLGNYHNMCDIDEVLGGKRPARIGREFVAISDIESLIEMLLLATAALADVKTTKSPTMPSLGDFSPMMEKLWNERSPRVLGIENR